MLVMYVFWATFRAIPRLGHALDQQDTDVAHSERQSMSSASKRSESASPPASLSIGAHDPVKPTLFGTLADLVDVHAIDLYRDEHAEDEHDREDDEERERRLKGRWRVLWRVWYVVA